MSTTNPEPSTPQIIHCARDELVGLDERGKWQLTVNCSNFSKVTWKKLRSEGQSDLWVNAAGYQRFICGSYGRGISGADTEQSTGIRTYGEPWSCACRRQLRVAFYTQSCSPVSIASRIVCMLLSTTNYV